MALPRSGHTKHNIHLTIADVWILRAFEELMGFKVPQGFENAFIEQFKDRLLYNITTVDFLKDIFEELNEESNIFKYKGD